MKGASSNEGGKGGLQQAATPAARAGQRIEVSLVIPVRDEEKTLPALIDSLRAQTFFPSEVVIVDGGSTDGTIDAARRLTAGDERFRVVEAGAATPGRGRNVGTAAARSEWIAYTDAGIRAEPAWLERLALEAERDPSVEVVYGNYEPQAATAFERAAALVCASPKRVRPGGRMRGPFIASSLMRRDVWRRVGGFPDLRAAEDLIFMERIEAQGVRTAWSPTATVWWQLPPTLARTFRRFALFSKHNVWAGRQRFWHYGVARQYAFALVFVALALVHSFWWLVVIALWLAARAAKTISRHSEGRGLRWALSPVQFLYVLVILLVVDLATFTGWARALLSKPKAQGDARAAATGRSDA
jgi:glycosyltransferase involved in cell wall biosynthesis